MIALLAQQGQQHFGENYVQEALAKIAELRHHRPRCAAYLALYWSHSAQQNQRPSHTAAPDAQGRPPHHCPARLSLWQTMWHLHFLICVLFSKCVSNG